MPRFVSPTGVTVDVSGEKGEVLRGLGYEAEKSESKAPAKKAASSKSEK